MIEELFERRVTDRERLERGRERKDWGRKEVETVIIINLGGCNY